MKNKGKAASGEAGMETALQKKEATSAETLIAQAINKGVPVETMEKLLTMRRELKAEWAKEQYDKAMADFQRECPTIKKTTIVYEKNQQNIPEKQRKVRYRYARLDSIIEQTKKPMAENGLSYTIRTGESGKEGMMRIIIRVSHIAGHSVESYMDIPIGTEQYMSEVQKYGARITFAKRYVFMNAFGIMTGDEDTDAREDEALEPKAKTRVPQATSDQPKMISPAQLKFMKKLIDEIDGISQEKIETQFNKKLEQFTSHEASGAIDQLTKWKNRNGEKNKPERNRTVRVDQTFNPAPSAPDNSDVKEGEIVK
jgi:hypothetical protein